MPVSTAIPKRIKRSTRNASPDGSNPSPSKEVGHLVFATVVKWQTRKLEVLMP